MQLPTVATLATFGATFSSVVLIEYFHAPLGQRAVAEGAVVEETSAALWFIAAAVSFVIASRRRHLRGDLLLIGYLLLIFGLRELDFQTRFTTWNLTQPIKYTKSEIPLLLRIGLILTLGVPLVTALVLAATRWRRYFFRGWLAHARWTRGVALWFWVLILSRVADKLTGRWENWHPTAYESWLFRAGEESLELALAALSLLLVVSIAFLPESKSEALPSGTTQPIT